MDKDSVVWDCVMIGAGPAALSAAVYTAREDIKTLIIEKKVIGGLAAITEKVDNYPGFAQGVSGMELADQLEQQALRFGAKIELDSVASIAKQANNNFKIVLASDKVVLAKTVLIASGSEWKKLNIEGEAEFYGKGIHNCATCDGAFYRDKKLIIIGGGNSSAQESLFLTKFASEIEILIRGEAWKASHVLVEKINEHPKIKVSFQTKPLKIVGTDKLQAVEVERAGIKESLPTDGVFVFIGLRPVVDFLKDSGVALDDYGFVLTDDTFKTNVDGIFCAGDVRSGATMQIASAVGEGASAALAIRHYLEES